MENKICKDCKHGKQKGWGQELSCHRWPVNLTQNIVTGEMEDKSEYILCSYERQEIPISSFNDTEQRCGPEGKFFEPKGTST